jgi:hypothetical protein
VEPDESVGVVAGGTGQTNQWVQWRSSLTGVGSDKEEKLVGGCAIGVGFLLAAGVLLGCNCWLKICGAGQISGGSCWRRPNELGGLTYASLWVTGRRKLVGCAVVAGVFLGCNRWQTRHGNGRISACGGSCWRRSNESVGQGCFLLLAQAKRICGGRFWDTI